MARKTTTPSKTATAGAACKAAPLDLTTAKIADGQVRAPTSVYEMVGIPTHSYGSLSYDQYQRQLQGMSLWELQTHAQKLGVLASGQLAILVDRLEKAYLRATARFSQEAVHGGREPNKGVSPFAEDAKRILSRGR